MVRQRYRPPCSVLNLTLATCCFAWSMTAAAENWSHFHGNDINGVATADTLPDLADEANIAWRASLTSQNVGSPVVFDGRVYLLDSADDGSKMIVRCLELSSGSEIWSRPYQHRSHHLHKRNTYASSTPAVDAERVVVCWSEPEHTLMVCLNHNGDELWSRDFGTWQSQHGFGTSPRIVDDKIVLFNSQQAEQLRPGQTAGKSRMIAVEASTGKTVWETPLNAKRSCYGVPAIHEGQLIGANTAQGLFGISIDSGRLLWNLPVFEMRCCSSPIVVGNIAIGSSGSGGGGNHLVAVRIPNAQDKEPEQIYRIDRGAPYVPTSVVFDNMLFMIDDKGIASCVDARSGKSYWQKRIGGNFGASPVLIGDKVLMISLDGNATVVSASLQFKKLAEIDLGGPVGATPAVADGHVLIRIGTELVCWKSE